ncbi:hypothetical protein L210DRAFT_3559519 [Boletus edulis BED1]|uniref:Secreted protein n=1 Tax=Boletus edulis BED1 TaxID=1328754 RepID=A0AAD4BID2_BOLED|nr:hypothetical protein L210DRAFT_3559519 [Boletus edulis BED1]
MRWHVVFLFLQVTIDWVRLIKARAPRRRQGDPLAVGQLLSVAHWHRPGSLHSPSFDCIEELPGCVGSFDVGPKRG